MLKNFVLMLAIATPVNAVVTYWESGIAFTSPNSTCHTPLSRALVKRCADVLVEHPHIADERLNQRDR